MVRYGEGMTIGRDEIVGVCVHNAGGSVPRDERTGRRNVMREKSRREVLALGGGVLAVAGGPGRAAATPAEAAAEIAKFTGGKTAERGKVSIDLPEIAENGNTVPLSIVVDSPMTTDDHVSDIMVVAEANPRPGLAGFPPTPHSRRVPHARGARPASALPRPRTSSWWRRPPKGNSTPSRSKSR